MRGTIVPRMAPAALVAVSCPLLVLLCIAFVDRAAASFAHAAFGGRDLVFRWLTHVVDPLVPMSALGLVGAALAALSGWRPGRAGRVVIACCLAVAVALLFRQAFKYGFGRLWPETWVQDNPSWIRDGAYGFHPFHGGMGWSSFPSGHMTVISAPVAVIWLALPQWRLVAALPAVAVAVGLYGADFHFVGDIVAGTYLGVACGTGCWALASAAAPAIPLGMPGGGAPL